MTTDEKRLQDQMQAHEDRCLPGCRCKWCRETKMADRAEMERVRELIRTEVEAAATESTRSGFTDRRESDETGPGVPEGGGGLRGALEALRKRPCENYDAPGHNCITAGPQVLAAEGCGPCVARASQAPREALEALADEWEWDAASSHTDTMARAMWVGALGGCARDLRAALAAHPAPEPAADPGVDVVEQVAQMLSGNVYGPSAAIETCRKIARALADAGLLVDPEVSEHRLVCDQCHATKATLRAAQADRNQWKRAAEITGEEIGRWRQSLITVEGERDRARDLAAALEADNARLTEERDEARAGWQRMSDYADHRGTRVAELEAENWEFIEARKQRDAAEARARRAEDALRRIEALFAGGPDTPCRTTWRSEPGVCDCLGGIECVEVPLDDLRDALSAADQTSDATPSDATTEEDA